MLLIMLFFWCIEVMMTLFLYCFYVLLTCSAADSLTSIKARRLLVIFIRSWMEMKRLFIGDGQSSFERGDKRDRFK